MAKRSMVLAPGLFMAKDPLKSPKAHSRIQSANPIPGRIFAFQKKGTFYM